MHAAGRNTFCTMEFSSFAFLQYEKTMHHRNLTDAQTRLPDTFYIHVAISTIIKDTCTRIFLFEL